VGIHWYRDQGWLVFRCNDEPCVFCLAKHRRQQVLLLPVLDAVNQEVSLLPVPRENRAGSLLDALRPYLRQDTGKALLEIFRSSTRRYQVMPLAGADRLDLGDEVIQSFVHRLRGMSPAEVGDYFRSSYRKLSNRELLRDFPELAARIKHRRPDLDLDRL